MYTISLAIAQHLYGIGLINVDKMIAVDNSKENHNIFYSALGSPGPSGSKMWVWTKSMEEALPQLMTNISISMLSNPLGSSQIATNTQCLYSTVFYDYNPLQLAVTYGAATVATIICLAFGFWAIVKNRTEETIGFSRVLVSALNPVLYDAAMDESPPLTEKTKLRATAGEHGHFEPMHNVSRKP